MVVMIRRGHIKSDHYRDKRSVSPSHNWVRDKKNQCTMRNKNKNLADLFPNNF